MGGITGSWTDNYDNYYAITQDTYREYFSWNSGLGTSTIIGWGSDFVLLRQGNGTYAPGTYQKIEWTWDSTGTNYYSCVSTSGHATLDAAVTADVTGVHIVNSTHDICGSFSNTRVMPVANTSN